MPITSSFQNKNLNALLYVYSTNGWLLPPCIVINKFIYNRLSSCPFLAVGNDAPTAERVVNTGSLEKGVGLPTW